MQRHDGSDYLPELFSTGPPTAKQSIALVRMMQEATAWNLVIIIAQVVLVAEVVRTYPAEFRMICRMIARRKPNMAEMLFLSIKYLALMGVTFDILVADTFAARTNEQCRAWAWTATTMYFLCSVLVFCVLAWRSQIIFRTCRWARWLLVSGLSGQLALAMYAAYRVDKPDAMSPAGTCVPRRTLEHRHHSSSSGDPEDGALHVWQSATFWWLLYSTFFDLAMLIATGVRLIRTSSGPQGLTKIAKVLVVNNLHYLLGVETCNFIELVLLIGWTSALPPLHQTSIAIQVVIGMQMLIGEQEAVYSPTYSRTGFAGASRGATGAASGTGASSGTGHVGATSYVTTTSTTSSNATKFEMQTRGLSHPPIRSNTYNSVNSSAGNNVKYGRRQRNDTVSTFQTLPYIVDQKERDFDDDLGQDTGSVPPQVPPKHKQPNLALHHSRYPSAATLTDSRAHSDDDVAIEMVESRAHIGILSPSAFSVSTPSNIEGVGSGVAWPGHSRHRSSKNYSRPNDKF